MSNNVTTYRVIRVTYPDDTKKYYLSTRSEAPYLDNRAKGPYLSEYFARQAFAEEVWGGELTDEVITLPDHQCKEVAWDKAPTTYGVCFRLPLEEFTERLADWNWQTPEAAALREEMAVSFQTNAYRLAVKIDRVRLDTLKCEGRVSIAGQDFLKFYVDVEVIASGPKTKKTDFMSHAYVNMHCAPYISVPFLGVKNCKADYEWND